MEIKKKNSQDILHKHWRPDSTHGEVDFSNQLFYSLGLFLTYWLQGIHKISSDFITKSHLVCTLHRTLSIVWYFTKWSLIAKRLKIELPRLLDEHSDHLLECINFSFCIAVTEVASLLGIVKYCKRSLLVWAENWFLTIILDCLWHLLEETSYS